MNEWMGVYEWMWMNEQINESMNGCEWMKKLMDNCKWVNYWINEWMWMNEQMNGRMGEMNRKCTSAEVNSIHTSFYVANGLFPSFFASLYIYPLQYLMTRLMNHCLTLTMMMMTTMMQMMMSLMQLLLVHQGWHLLLDWTLLGDVSTHTDKHVWMSEWMNEWKVRWINNKTKKNNVLQFLLSGFSWVECSHSTVTIFAEGG